DYLNDDRQIHREPKNLGGMDATGRAESHRTAQDSGTGKMKFACLEDDRFVKRLVLPTVAFAHVNAQQNGVFGKLHEDLPNEEVTSGPRFGRARRRPNSRLMKARN